MTGRSARRLDLTNCWWRLAVAILVVGLLVRLGLIAMTPDLASSGMDGPSYQASALALLQDGPFADTWQIRVFPPGYAGLLAVSYALMGSQTPLWLLLAQTALLLAAATFLARQGRTLLGPVGSLVLLGALTLLPSTIEVSTSLMYEGILVPASMLLCAGLLQWFSSSGQRGGWILAVSSFAMVATHPRSLVIPAAVAVVLVVGCRRFRTPALMAVGAIAPLPLLALRNVGAQGAFNLSSNLGSNLAMGLPPESEAVCTERIFSPSDYPRLNPADDARFVECSVDEIRNSPLSWIGQIPDKLLDHFEPAVVRIVHGDRAPVQLIGDGAVAAIRMLSLAALIALIALGIFYVARSRSGGGALASALALPIVLTAALSVLFYGRERFSYPSLPFAYVLVVGGLMSLAGIICRQRMGSRQQRSPDDPAD
jgi:hypothetical protein